MDKNTSKKWIKIVSDLHKISNIDPQKWRLAIQTYVNGL